MLQSLAGNVFTIADINFDELVIIVGVDLERIKNIITNRCS